jgi:hypothetical protein
MTRAYEGIEVCPHCDELVDPGVHDYDAYEFTYQHAGCLADRYWREREAMLTSAGVVDLEEVSVVEHVNGRQGETQEHFHRATCPECYHEHRRDGGEDARREMIDALLECCGVEWVTPADYVTDCDICGHDHRGEYNCRPPTHREPFPGVEQDYRCAACGWTGAGEALQGPTGECPECDSPAVTPVASTSVDRGRGVATDGGIAEVGTYEVTFRYWGPDHEPGEADWDHVTVEAADEEEAREQAVAEATGGGIKGFIEREHSYDVVEIGGPYDA